MAFSHDNGCNSWCDHPIHAILIVTDINGTIDQVQDYCEWEGFIFLSAKRAVKLDTNKVKRHVTVTINHKTKKPIWEPWQDNEPASVWCARIQVPEGWMFIPPEKRGC